MKTLFSQRILREVSKIPKGEISSYSEIARRAGYEGCARAAGSVLAKNKKPVVIPCHRVVLKNGGVGNYSGGVEKKIKLLKLEGIKIENNKVKK